MIQKSRPVTTTKKGEELGSHGTSLLHVAAYDCDYTDREFIWHWHRELEIIRVADGSLLVSTPGEQIVLNKGDMFFINSGVMHTGTNAGAGKCILQSVLYLPEFLCNGIEGVFWQKYICPFIENSRLRSVTFPVDTDNATALRNYMDEFWLACKDEPFGYEFTIREQLSKILVSIISDSDGGGKPMSVRNQRSGERVKMMLEFIHKNYASDITNSALAACAFVSESECLRSFRNVLGTTPIQYVKKYRLQLAADMLTTTDYSVTEIAGLCGFGHMSYFTRAFDEMFGITPREYRKMNGEKSL
jgi:AraC-like DNA-binding protein/mannose-6-phosphate isomerase-like protein (cupin superfamily)